MQLAAEPQVVQVVLRDADDDGDAVVGAHLGEGPGGVAGGLDDEDPLLAGVHPRQHGIGFRLLERTGAHLRADAGIPAGERDVQVLQAQVAGQALGLVGHRGAGLAERALDGHPVGIAVDAVQVVPRGEPLVLIDGPHEGRAPAFGVAHRPARVVEDAAGGDVHQSIGCRFEAHTGFSLRASLAQRPGKKRLT